MTKLRSNVELCLTVDGVGLLIVGWVFQTQPGRLTAILHDGTQAPADLARTWVRVPRSDVLESLGAGAVETVVDANRECGFVALAPLSEPRSLATTPRFELCFGNEVKGALDLPLSPLEFTEPMDPASIRFLRHNVKALVTLFRRHQVLGAPSVLKLLDAVGAEASHLARAAEADSRVGVDLCVFGAGEGLLLAGWLTGGSEVTGARVSAGGGDDVDIRPFMHFLPVQEGSARRRRFVVAVPSSKFPAFSPRLDLGLQFVGGQSLTVKPQVSSGPEALTRIDGILDSETWLALSEAMGEHFRPQGGVVSDSLAQALRLLATRGHDATQHIVHASADRIAAAIDRAFIVPNLGVLTIGWLLDPDQQVSSLHAHVGEGPSPDLLPGAARVVRHDIRREYARWLAHASVDCFGFVSLVRLPGMRPEALESSLYYTLRTRSGTRRRLRTPVLRRCEGNPLPMIREILGCVSHEELPVLTDHVGPVVESLWSGRTEENRAEPIYEIGDQVPNPNISIIVPIYGRYDYIEYQMSLFADDPDLRTAEIIYVIDDPRISEEAVRFCREIHPLFRLPVRIVACRHNRGFAAANNVGVSAARGRLLLLLNSDVMPKQPGWLSELRRLHDSLPNPGALGAKLLFPDRSLQHGGMRFERMPSLPGLWLNSHPGKGLPTEQAEKGTLLPAQAVTAACLMVSRELYLAMGGLDESYILGDFEDSDFCLKLRRAGRQIYCASGVELYHLERQSQRLVGVTEWRTALTLYNAWLHTKRWDGAIQQLASGSA